MSGIGHNHGPPLAAGAGWRRHCWSRARRDLLPHLPLNVVRRRVARARALGLDYTTYATVRATTGCDIVAFLFSSNALHLMRAGDTVPQDRAGRLSEIEGAALIALMAPPLPVPDRAPRPLDSVAPAPAAMALWRDQRALTRAALAGIGVSPDAVLLVGAAPWESAWSAAGGLAGYLNEARYFAEVSPG